MNLKAAFKPTRSDNSVNEQVIEEMADISKEAGYV